MKKQLYILSLSVLFTVMSSLVFAGNDPTIQGKLRADIGMAMNGFIKHNSYQSNFIIYDAVAGKLLHLNFDKLHTGIIKKGSFYVSCADFKDAKGNKYDIDFLVGQQGGELLTMEAIVHSVNGNKRKYHIESK